jgi:SHS2 domain-containing protein
MTAQPDGDRGAPPPSHEFVEHTSEVILKLRAGSWPALLEEAARGLSDLQLKGQGEAPGTETERAIAVEAGDEAALLVDWLNELIYLAESERFVATDAVADEADEHRIRATARGVTVAAAPALVKAATLHGLCIERTGRGLEAAVVLDV